MGRAETEAETENRDIHEQKALIEWDFRDTIVKQGERSRRGGIQFRHGDDFRWWADGIEKQDGDIAKQPDPEQLQEYQIAVQAVLKFGKGEESAGAPLDEIARIEDSEDDQRHPAVQCVQG